MKYKNEKTLYRYVDQFEKKLERNKSKHTIVNYLSDLKVFAKWLVESDKVNDIEQFTQEDFLDYMDFLKDKFAPATVRRRSVSLNEFLVFLNRTGRLKKAPFVDSKEMMEYLPVVQKKKVRALVKAEIKNLIFSSGNLLEECLVRFAFDTGCRVSEIVAAKWSDIDNDFDRNILTVMGKGKGGMTKSRTVRISKNTMEKLDEWKEDRGFESEYIFVSERTKKPLTERRINQILAKIGENCFIEDLSSHIFRKSIATNLLKNGMDITYVSKYLGHASVNTTINNYVDTETDLHDKVDEFFGEEV